jgi:hypothetical protein
LDASLNILPEYMKKEDDILIVSQQLNFIFAADIARIKVTKEIHFQQSTKLLKLLIVA